MDHFTSETIGRIGYYVYTLTDPRTNKVFYVGKGFGNRVFNHEKCAISTDGVSEKLDTIRQIHSEGLEVIKDIKAHNLTSDEAFIVESIFINEYKLKNLTNIVDGHHSEFYSSHKVEEIEEMYNCPEIELDEDDKFICLNINKSFLRDEDLYEKVREVWTLNADRASKANYILIVWKGIVKEMYKDAEWTELFGKWNKSKRNVRKWRFTATKVKRHKYLGTDISKYIKFKQNPVRYYNI